MATDPLPWNVAEPADLSLVELCWRLLWPNKATKQRTLRLSPTNLAGAGTSSATLAGKWPATSSPLLHQALRGDAAMADESERSGRCSDC
jgi:hypothetical protein